MWLSRRGGCARIEMRIDGRFRVYRAEEQKRLRVFQSPQQRAPYSTTMHLHKVSQWKLRFSFGVDGAQKMSKSPLTHSVPRPQDLRRMAPAAGDIEKSLWKWKTLQILGELRFEGTFLVCASGVATWKRNRQPRRFAGQTSAQTLSKAPQVHFGVALRPLSGS